MLKPGSCCSVAQGSVGLWLCALVVFGLGASGCRELLDSEQFAVEDVGPHQGILDFASAECVACVADACVEPLEGCLTASECALLGQCFSESPGPGWRSLCEARHPTGAVALSDLGMCFARSCGAECGGGRSWQCLGEKHPRAQPKAAGFSYAVNFGELFSNQALPGLSVRACSRGNWVDPECGVSLRDQGVTDALGNVQLDISFDFLAVRQPWDGYLKVEGPDIYPDLRLFTKPIVADLRVNSNALALTTVDRVARTYAVELLPGRGMLAGTMFDCVAVPAPGVRFELAGDPLMRRFYSLGGLILTESATETSADGIVLFVNVPAGKHRIQAYIAETAELIGDYELLVLAGTRTAVLFEAQSE